MHNNKIQFQNRFNSYLEKKVSSKKKEQLFGGQFNYFSPKPSNLNSPNSSTIPLTSNSSNFFSNYINNWQNQQPKQAQSINQNQMDCQNTSKLICVKSSNQKLSQEISYQRKRLKKLRELEENECAICLDQIKNRCQLDCKHKFCFSCLQQWLKTSNNCPYCRAKARSFWYKGEEYTVEERQFQYEPEDQEQEMDWVCYNCQATQQGDIVLICDRCEVNACHIKCDPELRGREPRGDWYCHFCR